MKYAEIISKMTLEEKAGLCSGLNFWNTKPVERLGIPSIMVTDGPHGLRKQPEGGDHVGLGGSVPATCFPPACLSAASWDRAMLRKIGESMAEEALQEKVSVILGPGTNIKRSPLCGRNFEYFSEDPYLAGEMATEFIKGVQSKGIGTSLKHFAGNNQEKRRMTIDSVIDERALNEIYLPAFEAAVKRAQPWTVMNAYNKLNGTYCAENNHLLTEILREKWGFKGIVVTDWGAENDRVAGIKAGNDLEMPSSGGINDAKIVQAVEDGKLDEKVLDECVDRLLDLIHKSQEPLKTEHKYDALSHHNIARKMAANSMVLLKNEDGVLPIEAKDDYCVIGKMAKQPRYQGAGSSIINPTKLDNAYDLLKEEYGVEPPYADGYKTETDEVDEALIAEAVEIAEKSKFVLLYIGLTDLYESEAFDREHMRLPDNQLALIEELAKVNDNIIVLLHTGSPVEMPFISSVKAVLNCYLGGQAGAGAALDIIFGKVNPSGKLPETFPINCADNPSYENFPGNHLSVEYRESIFVGYRYYDTAAVDVLFPFGYGLSYTDFEYSDIKVSSENLLDTDNLEVKFTVKNTGSVAGAEVAQIYVHQLNSTIFKANKELKGFRKVFLEPGESRELSVILDKRSFAYFNVDTDDFEVETGKYDILVGASSADIRLEKTVRVTSSKGTAPVSYRDTAPHYYGADIKGISAEEFEVILGRKVPPCDRNPGDPFDFNSTLTDLGETKNGAKIVKFVKFIANNILKGSPQDKRMMVEMTMATPLRSLILMSTGAFTEDMAELVIYMCTDSIFLGLVKFIGKLPKLLKGVKGML